MAISSLGGYLDTAGTEPPTPGRIPQKLQRRIALEMCLNAGNGKSVVVGWPERYGIVLDDKTAFEKKMSFVQGLGPAFKFFHDTQWVLAKDESGAEKPVNVFDYMMMSSVYSFNFKQQQAVLNAYFIDSPFNATSKMNNSENSVWVFNNASYAVAQPRSYKVTESSGAIKIVSVNDLAKDAIACQLFRPIREQDIEKNGDGSPYNYCALDKSLKNSLGGIDR